jgi:hypothetical protein
MWTNKKNSKGEVHGIATPPIDAVQERASVLVDPEVLEAVVRGAGAGVHLEVLRGTTRDRPVHSDLGLGEDNFARR